MLILSHFVNFPGKAFIGPFIDTSNYLSLNYTGSITSLNTQSGRARFDVRFL